MLDFSDLKEQELLALAISLEEEDSRSIPSSPEASAKPIHTPPRSSATWRRKKPATATACSICT